MKSLKTTGIVTGVAMALLTLTVAFPTQAASNTQEHMGQLIKERAWLRWSGGRVQTEMGHFIRDGALSGKMSQEALGSGIASAAHIQVALMRNQEQLGEAILNRHVGGRLGAVQASLGQKIQNEAQISWIMSTMAKAAFASLEGDTSQQIPETLIAQLRSSKAFAHEKNFRLAMRLLENETGQAMTGLIQSSPVELAAAQVAMGKDIRDQAQTSWIMGMMAKSAFSSLEGQQMQTIPNAMIKQLRNNKAFEQENNFRLAMSLLEKERGQSMTQLIKTPAAGAGSLAAVAPATTSMGGFMEFGALAISAFLYVGWVFSKSALNLSYPKEIDEDDDSVELQDAA